MVQKEPQHDRIVLLNTMLSHSTAKTHHDAPVLGALESLKILDGRRKKGWAIEYLGLDDKTWHKGKDEDRPEEDCEQARRKAGEGLDCLRLSAMRFEETDDFIYATLLVESLDANSRSFPVVNIENFEGREIAADRKERGSAAAHVCVQIPKDGDLDLGEYRCAIETVHPITRTEIESLLNRQLRRYAEALPLTFGVDVHKGKKLEHKIYRYTPKLELAADVGRKLSFDGKILSLMVFTKRSQKQNIGKGAEVKHEEVTADMELRISANQGPDDPEERKAWAEGVKAWYAGLGFESRFYFRHANGRIEGGSLHKAIAGATDLLMCAKEQIFLKKAPKKWVSSINAEIEMELRKLLETDGLWERRK